MKKKILNQRVRDLEVLNRHIIHVLLQLSDKQRPKWGNWAMYALREGITADEFELLEFFWQWANRQDKNTLTKEALVERYEAIVPPRLKGKLPAICEARRRDGIIGYHADLVLGPDPEARGDIDEDVP